MHKQKIYLVAMNLSQTSVSPTTNLILEMANGFRNIGCESEIIELASREKRDAHSPFKTMVVEAGIGFRYALNILRGLRLFSKLIIFEKQKKGGQPIVYSVSLYPFPIFLLASFCRTQKVPMYVYIFEEWISLLLYDDISLVKRVMGSIRRIPSSMLLYGVCTRMVTGVAVIVDEMQHFLVRRFKVDASKFFCFPNVVSGEGGQCSVNSVQCSVNSVQCSVNSVQCSVNSVQCSVNSVQLSSTSVKQLSRDQCAVNSDQLSSTSVKQLSSKAGDGGRYVVFGGALSFTKDAMSKTLEALEILKARGVVIGLRIYGKVGMRQQQRLLSEAQQLKIADQVRLMGYVERTVLEQDLQQAVGSLIIKCDTPFNRYNFPTKMMDALKMRVPVIASTGNLFRTYFTDRISACLVNPSSASEIADAIQYLAEHPKAAREMADQAHKLLEDEFNAEAVCRRFLVKFGFQSASC